MDTWVQILENIAYDIPVNQLRGKQRLLEHISVHIF